MKVLARGCSRSSAAISAGSAFKTSRRSSARLSPTPTPTPTPPPDPGSPPPPSVARQSALGSLTRSTASTVLATTCSMSSPRTAPVAISSPSATAGEEAARRSIAPSISTCSAPSSIIASLTARTSAAALGPATSTVPGSESLARTTSPSGVLTPVCARRSWATPLARSSSPVVATRLPAARCRRGFSMRASITSCASPSRPIEVTPTGLAAAACSARIAPSVSVLPVFLASPTRASRRVPDSSAVSRAGVSLAIRAGCAGGAGLAGSGGGVGHARGQLAHDEARHVVRVGALREARVVAELLGELVGHARAAAGEDQLLAPPLRLDDLDELGQVMTWRFCWVTVCETRIASASRSIALATSTLLGTWLPRLCVWKAL